MSIDDLALTNESLQRNEGLVARLGDPAFLEELGRLHVDWTARTAYKGAELSSFLIERGFAKESGDHLKLNRLGLLFLGRLCIDFKEQVGKPGQSIGSYRITNILSIGKNSALCLAEHSAIGNRFVLKFIRPGAADNALQAVRTVSSGDFSDSLVKPTDFLELSLTDVFGRPVDVPCTVFPFVPGLTLRKFLDDPLKSLSPHALETFIRQVGSVLIELDRLGAYHGDLHAENIIVTQDHNGALLFRVIDVSFGAAGSKNAQECIDNDLIEFRRHVWRMLSVQQTYIPQMSIRKYLGARLYGIVSKILSDEIQTFSQLREVLESDANYSQFVRQKKLFLEKRFNPPASFRLQRYEEISDPTVALKLFVPFPELMQKIEQFNNVYVAGNRGSGKSTYLAALAFFPEVRDPYVDYQRSFGIYFPCRQGEFRPLAAATTDVTPEIRQALLKHLVIVKVLRRTLELLAAAIRVDRIKSPNDLMGLRDFLARFTQGVELPVLDPNTAREMNNLVAAFTRIEMKEIERLLADNSKEGLDATRIANESDLMAFFEVVRRTFEELGATQFHILFDDAGEPYMPRHVQMVMNDLILSSNSVFCVKFTAEKHTYILESSKGKTLENGHDYFAHDISAILFLGSQNLGLSTERLQRHFWEIVARRLEQFEFQSANIIDYLGENPYKSANLINSLASARKNAYYAGWYAVWNIADRTPRNLLELVSEIFASGGIDKDSPPQPIHGRSQNRAIRLVSEKRLASLTQIGGVIKIRGVEYSLGRKLFDVATVIGSTFRVYLRAERGKDRKVQHLAIERNDSGSLSDDAQCMLDRLVSFGVLDDAKIAPARDDEIKKPLYVLNRIYCPAFDISFRRDRHLMLSQGKMEQLLLDPDTFMHEGTKMLRRATSEGAENRLLFDFE